MIKMWVASLKGLKRGLCKMAEKASFWTAIGALAIPLGVVVLQVAGLSSPWGVLALVLVVFGLVSVAVGWGYIVAAGKREVAEEKRRSEEHRLAVRREKANIIILAHIAEGLKVDMNKVQKMLEDKLDDE